MEWVHQPPQQQLQQPKDHHNDQNNDTGNGGNGGGVVEVLYGKVMTDEQLEILQTQISDYATICEQLVEMHKSITDKQELAFSRMGNLHCDPLVASVGNKITARQRWTPTPVQLEILEHIFYQCTGSPSKQKIKYIAAELFQHGPISETNVDHWFQNRRARSKRKRLNISPNNAESKVEKDAESPREKKTKPRNLHSQRDSAPRAEDHCFKNRKMSFKTHFMDPRTNKVEELALQSISSSKLSESLGQLCIYESIPENSGIYHLAGKLEVPGSYSLYREADDYSLTD
ncbi:hypothetical protein Nepgr_026996 [Nepenthes gracilis]|uniref:Homeobox domain-containing protein n=1 Tax=Nepenthes gracilis TaxID=150966 RepID=A0AAD3Y134_NEPGR|nr:hypothetical protein Nepgr_026996 [Nepenthes gracilis]